MPKSMSFSDAVGGEHHVGGLDVAVGDVLFVGVTEGGEALVGEVDDFVGGHRGAGDAVGERFAFDVLDDHDELIFVGERGAERGDVGMVERGEETNFAKEAVGERLVGGEVGEKDLHRLDALGDDVADFVDFAHAAGAEDGNDFVVADVLAGGKSRAHAGLRGWVLGNLLGRRIHQI